MSKRLFVNNFETALTAAINSTTNDLPLADFAALEALPLRFPDGEASQGGVFVALTLQADGATDPGLSDTEIVHIHVADATASIPVFAKRGMEGTTAKSWASGDVASARVTAASAVGEGVLYPVDTPTAVRISPDNQPTFTVGADAVRVGGSGRAEGGKSASVGFGSKSDGADSIAVGNQAIADGLSSIAVGKNAFAPSDSAVVIGEGADTVQLASVVIGLNAAAGDAGGSLDPAAENSVAIGSGAIATFVNDVALGFQALADHANAAAVGANTSTTAADQVNVGDHDLEVGTSTSQRGVHLYSPDGSRWLLTVDNTGAISATSDPV